MNSTYHFSPGKVLIKSRKFRHNYWGFNCLVFIIKFILTVLIFLGTAWITKNVFAQCIEKYSLSNSINLGAIFATFASSIISIVILLSTVQANQFNKNVEILQTQIMKSAKWEHWPFIKRIRKQKTAPGKYRYQYFQNAEIAFEGFRHPAVFPIPISTEDSRDVMNVFYYVKMIFMKNQYSYYLSTQPSHDFDILVWDCLSAVYKNIIWFKIYQYICYIGGAFIINGILFAFFYYQYSFLINEILGFIKSV